MEAKVHALHAHSDEALGKNESIVLAALRSAKGTLSAYEILARTAKRGVRAPTQVYRALETLVGRGLVHRIEILNAYVVCDRVPHSDEAGFAVCSRCGNVDEVPLATVGAELGRLAAAQEFQLHKAHVELLGLCKTCAAEISAASAQANTALGPTGPGLMGRKARDIRRALVVAAVLAAAIASSDSHAQVRQLGPHVHGAATLDIVIDANDVSMELEGAGADLLGFENAPQTPGQNAAWAALQVTLARPLDLFVFPAVAACAATSATSVQVLLGAPDAPGSATPGTIGDYAAQTVHSNIDATYELRCANPKALTAVNFAIFAKFPTIQAIHVEILSGRGDFAFDVGSGQPRLALNGVV